MNTTELQRTKQRYNIVGNSDGLNHALDVALQVAPTDLSVLIVGESGVGKEIIPRVIHDSSPRRREKYFAINCGSIPEGTIDSELFGHETGSFTGAVGESEGYFGIANKGTIFLDEVGPGQRRRGCFVCWKQANISVWADRRYARRTCVLWPPPTSICARPSARGSSVKTCSID